MVETGGTAGTGVWKWLDLSALTGATFTVATGALTQTFDLGGREDGLAIDKIVFAPDGEVYTVAALDSGIYTPAPSSMLVFTIVASEVRQTIDGFGASSAWTSPALSNAQSDALFSPHDGPRAVAASYAHRAQRHLLRKWSPPSVPIARGARVWATPWSPPAEWKSNNDVNNGGNLLPERYPRLGGESG